MAWTGQGKPEIPRKANTLALKNMRALRPSLSLILKLRALETEMELSILVTRFFHPKFGSLSFHVDEMTFEWILHFAKFALSAIFWGVG